MVSWEPIPAQKINFVPFAFEAKQVAGFTADSLLRVINGSGDPLTGITPLSNAQYTALLALANGSSTAYTKSGELGGVALPTMASGEVLGWNGSAWVSTTSTPGASSITTTMLQGGAVTGAKLDPAISISTSGTVASAITTTRDFKIFAASPSLFYVGMVAPALSASYTLTWPIDAGASGQFLTTNGSGLLTWTTPASAGITALTGDVTGTGPGSTATTVASVGGVTAANVAAGATSANAATAVNTASTIVRRDASGNFAASAISQTSSIYKDSGANSVTFQAPTTISSSYVLKLPTGAAAAAGQVLTSDLSGNLSWTTMSGAPTGAAGGDLSGIYPNPGVAQVGGYSAANVAAGATLANAATASNTVSAIVKRDGSGNFTATDVTTSSVKADTLKLHNAGSVVNVVNPIGAAYTLTLPTGTGSSGQVLSTNGSGVTSWIAPAAGSPWTTQAPGINYMGGNVGIGTTSPTAKLEVEGLLAIGGASPTFSSVANKDLSLTPGAAASTGKGSALLLSGGAGGSSSGDGGDVFITSGASTANGFKGGNITIASAAQPGPNGYGGDISIVTGSQGGTGYGGALNLSTGLGSVGGPINITSGVSYNLFQRGPPINIKAGNGRQGGGGDIILTAGNGADGGSGGNIILMPGTPATSSAGNIGVGTANPTEKLDVVGAIRIAGSASNAAGTLRWTGTNFQGSDGSAWFNIMPNPPAAGGCDQTQTFNTPGTYGYTAPASFATLTIKIWGAGGGGGSGLNGGAGGTGAASTVSSLSLSAGGGAGGQGNSVALGAGAGGTGGVAAGGTTNTSGNQGSDASSSLSGAGAAAPFGGSGGSPTAAQTQGGAGGSPGGGGGGGLWSSGNSGSGGGSGAYLEKTFTSATIPAGTTINDLVVGTGGVGQSGYGPGGEGGSGQISVTCSTTGAPAINNRALVFLDSGAYSSSTNLVYDPSGRVGIGTSTPQATLDINGTARLKKQTGAPAACSSSNDGTIALTSGHQLCVCDGSSWVRTTDGISACSW